MFLYDKYDYELPKILAIAQHDETGFDLPPSPFDQLKQPDRSHHLEAARRNHFRGKVPTDDIALAASCCAIITPE
jgi:hypothetical protein